MIVLRKPCWYKLIIRFLANVFYHCYCRCAGIFSGYFWVNLIFIKRSRNSSDIDALCLPTFRAEAQVTRFHEVSLFSSLQWHDSWKLHGPDNFLSTSHLIQSYCLKILTIAATIWCSKVCGRHSSAGVFLHYWAIDLWGKCFNAVAVLVARWQIYHIGRASDLTDQVISVDIFPVTDNELRSYSFNYISLQNTKVTWWKCF